MKKKLFLIALTIVIVNHGFGQQPSPAANLLPVLTPNSPEVAAFAKYGNYQVNMFNGTTGISIPLYEIMVGDLRVPITLNYHTSGIKVEDIPTYAGTGWSLNVGGVITRRIQGLPDEYLYDPVNNAGFGGYLNGNTVRIAYSTVPNNQEGLDYVRNIADDDRVDAEPDIYSYTLPGRSGKFVFNGQDNLKPVFIPYEPLTVTPTNITSNGMLFSMKDESGIKYDFNKSELTNNRSIRPRGIQIAVSSWLLTSMTSANGQNAINFNYSSLGNLGQLYANDNITVTDYVRDLNPYANRPYIPNEGTPSTEPYLSTYGSQSNLESITFKNGKVVFELANEAREDFGGMANLKKRLKSIKVYNLIGTTYNLIKEIDFYHSYFIRYAGHNYYDGNNDGVFGVNETYDANKSKRLRLDKIEVKGSSGTNPQVYTFEYNNNTDDYGMPERLAKAVDYWGYYNGKFANTLVPRKDIPFTPWYTDVAHTITIGAYTYGTREPDPAFMQACMLNKITYPTGGYTKFYYETNQYSTTNSSSNIKYAGGLRIQKLENYDGISSAPEVKTYVYGENESGYGSSNFDLHNYFFAAPQTRRYWDPGAGIAPAGSAVQTKQVRTYSANPSFSLETYDGSPVAYQYVTEYAGNPANNTGKTIYQFNFTPDYVSTLEGIGIHTVLTQVYHRGQVRFKTVYRRNQNNPQNPYSIISQIENQYSAFPENEILNIGLSVIHNIYASDLPAGVKLPPLDENPYTGTNGNPMPWLYSASPEYYLSNYSLKTGDNKLTKTIETLYDPDDPSKSVYTTKNYFYDNIKHQQVSRIETVNSKNETIINYLKYPGEFAQVGNVYKLMEDNNILNKIIESKKTVNSVQTELQKTNYYNWGNGNYLPQNIQVQTASNPIETRASFNNYNVNGDILEMRKSEDVNEIYLWGYGNQYPVAKIVGSDYTTVNSIVTQAEIDDAVNSGDEQILRDVLNALRTDVRTKNALITTYTYKPLIGMTSRTDINNRTTYYEYDDHGRLAIVRDQDKNVVKRICYNYSGQPENCNYFYSDDLSGYYYSENCTTPEVPDAVYVSVPLGMFTSTVSKADANTKALAYAQTEANTSGGCSIPMIDLIYSNGTGYGQFSITLYNTSTGQNLYFSTPANASGGILAQIPAGTYNIAVSPINVSGSYNYTVACTYYTYGNSASFYNVYLDESCNNIDIY